MHHYRPLLACAVSLAVLLVPGVSLALCSRPILPYCASIDDMSAAFVSPAECRRDLQKHAAQLTAYRSCLVESIAEVDQEAARVAELLERIPGESDS